MDHDLLFKELLTTFFSEFVELFLPEVAAYMKAKPIELLEKNFFSRTWRLRKGTKSIYWSRRGFAIGATHCF